MKWCWTLFGAFQHQASYIHVRCAEHTQCIVRKYIIVDNINSLTEYRLRFIRRHTTDVVCRLLWQMIDNITIFRSKCALLLILAECSQNRWYKCFYLFTIRCSMLRRLDAVESSLSQFLIESFDVLKCNDMWQMANHSN